jgi:hypothetical protein
MPMSIVLPPSDLPILQLTRCEFVINLETAGRSINIPPCALAIAP